MRESDVCVAFADDLAGSVHPACADLLWHVWDPATNSHVVDSSVVAFTAPTNVTLVGRAANRENFSANGEYALVGTSELQWQFWEPQLGSFVADPATRTIAAPRLLHVLGQGTESGKARVCGTYHLAGAWETYPLYVRPGTQTVIRYSRKTDRWLIDCEGLVEPSLMNRLCHWILTGDTSAATERCTAYAQACGAQHPGLSDLQWQIWDSRTGRHDKDVNVRATTAPLVLRISGRASTTENNDINGGSRLPDTAPAAALGPEAEAQLRQNSWHEAAQHSLQQHLAGLRRWRATGAPPPASARERQRGAVDVNSKLDADMHRTVRSAEWPPPKAEEVEQASRRAEQPGAAGGPAALAERGRPELSRGAIGPAQALAQYTQGFGALDLVALLGDVAVDDAGPGAEKPRSRGADLRRGHGGGPGADVGVSIWNDFRWPCSDRQERQPCSCGNTSFALGARFCDKCGALLPTGLEELAAESRSGSKPSPLDRRGPGGLRA
ncbi:unnamed protein product [Prorocentrum cordatum]|uniref:Uncharacterized protein n=1 Tax=Prorocentrum cordatum TaxID=2364126 RepID=A0ABN9T913_9DINO|nr:unnamed protein product [Polarella glacialis]